MKFVSYAHRLTDRTRPAFLAALEDTAKAVAKRAPRGVGSGPHMADQVSAEPTATTGRMARGRIVVNDTPGKVRMREFGGEIRPKPGRPLVFRSERTGQWVTIKHPRTVRQRPGGYSQGFKPWIRPAGDDFARSMEARLRQHAGLAQNRGNLRRR